MNTHSQALLEYRLILDACRNFTLLDAPNIETLPFFNNADELKHELRLVNVFRHCLATKNHGLEMLLPINEFLSQLQKEGSILGLEELGRIAAMMQTLKKGLCWLRELELGRTEREIVNSLIQNWRNPDRIIGILNPYFNPQGVFREEEIPELKAIVQHIQSLNLEIQKTARDFLTRNKDMWSSKEIAQRDGRVVLALKNDYRGRIDGFIHGTSGSGQTLYIEPQRLFVKNNALNEVKNEYHLEVRRILRLCTVALRPLIQELDDCRLQFRRFNSLQMRGRYSLAIKGNSAQISQSGFYLLQARHPMLKENAVPINIEMKSPKRVMLLSGPNTGGKTVAMKTLGLLSLMHQSGMEIPASEQSALPIFSDILVTIGDEQSIDTGLSTFSAHLRNLEIVLKGSDNKSLILIDELGSGTNPAEGSALALAILEVLAERKTYALITTHYDNLKAYAFKHPALDNASVTFNDNQPNYTIVAGIPGESHALKIAERIGINSEVVKRARMLMESKEVHINHLIEELGEIKSDLQEQQDQYQIMYRETEEKRSDLKMREQNIKHRELALKEQRLFEHNAFIANSRKKIEALLHELNLRKKTRDESDINKEVRQTLDNLKKEQELTVQEFIREESEIYPSEHVSPHMQARYQDGKIVQIIERGRKAGTWVILAGSVKMTVPERELQVFTPEEQQVIEKEKMTKPGKDNTSWQRSGKNMIPVEYTRGLSTMVLDIRGMRAEEALRELEKFLDQACLSSLQFFSIIHGKGNGVLQKLVHGYFKVQNQVKSLCFAPPDEGGFGKTYVYLRDV